MIPINYTQFQKDIKVKTEGETRYIFDPIRKKHLVLQPEELVRQLVIQYLLKEKSYPIAKMNVEKLLLINERRKRFDLIVYAQDMKPYLLVECKAPSVKLTQAVFDQIAIYNMPLQTDYLLVTNGILTYCCKMNYEEKTYDFVEEVPVF